MDQNSTNNTPSNEEEGNEDLIEDIAEVKQWKKS